MIGDFFFFSDEKFLEKTKKFRKNGNDDLKGFLKIIEEIVNLNHIKSKYQNEIKEIKEWNSESGLEEFLNLKIFSNDPFTKIMLFLNDLQLKSFKQKDDFFKSLEKDIRKVPIDLIKKRLIKRFLTIPFMSEPSSLIFMPILFSPKGKTQNFVDGLLEEEDYIEIIHPFLKSCLLSKNRSIRMRMLQTIQYYNFSFKPQLLLTEVMNGLFDSNDDLVMTTFDALFQLSKTCLKQDLDSLNRIIINLHRYSTSKSTSIPVRSHSLVILIKLYSFPNIKKNIILSAIEKILYDDNSELKLHGLNVILMNLQYFDPRELVSIIMKMILPLTLHEKSEVRLKTTRVLNSILSYLDEIDLSKYNYGNVTSEMPLEYMSQLKPEFPKESNQDIIRKTEFLGSGPNISNVISVNEILSENNDKEIVKNIQQNLNKELKELKDENRQEINIHENKDDSTKEIVNQIEDVEEKWENWDENVKKKETKKETPKNVTKKKKSLEEEDEDEEVISKEPDYFSQLGMIKKDVKNVKDLLNQEEIKNINLDAWTNEEQ